MTFPDATYRQLIHAVTESSRGELRALASQHENDPSPSEALVEDLRQTLAGHTQVGRSLSLTAIVLGPIPRDPNATRIARPLLTWINENPAA